MSVIDIGYVFYDKSTGKDNTVPFACDHNRREDESFEDYCIRMEYHEAWIKPRFPMPAIPVQVHWHPAGRNCCFSDSITFTVGEEHILVGIVDFDIDRCFDFHYNWAMYVHEFAIEEGTQRWRDEL